MKDRKILIGALFLVILAASFIFIDVNLQVINKFNKEYKDASSKFMNRTVGVIKNEGLGFYRSPDERFRNEIRINYALNTEQGEETSDIHELYKSGKLTDNFTDYREEIEYDEDEAIKVSVELGASKLEASDEEYVYKLLKHVDLILNKEVISRKKLSEIMKNGDYIDLEDEVNGYKVEYISKSEDGLRKIKIDIGK